jgi:hypothetical protein
VAGGSIGRGEADDLSDIDIHLAVQDERCAELNAHRRAFVSWFGEPLLVQEAPQNAPPGGAFHLVRALAPADAARQVSFSTTCFWAMAFITAKKIARRQPAAAFGLLRMMHQARDSVRGHLAGKPQPAWGAVAAPQEALPPTNPREQIVDLLDLLADMSAVQPTTDGGGGLVTQDAVSAIQRFVRVVSQDFDASDTPAT